MKKFILSLLGIFAFFGFGLADYTGTFTSPILNNSYVSSKSTRGFFFAKVPLTITSLDTFSTCPFQNGDSLNIYSGLNIISTGTFASGGLSTGIIFSFSSSVVLQPGFYYWTFYGTGGVARNHCRNSTAAIYTQQSDNQFTYLGGTEHGTATWTGTLTVSLGTQATITKYNYSYVGSVEPSFTVDYGIDTFQSTGTVYINGGQYIRNGQTISYDGLTGVNISRSDNIGGNWVDFYNNYNIYLSGAFTKSYTGLVNDWILTPYCEKVIVPYTGTTLIVLPVEFTGQILSGNYVYNTTAVITEFIAGNYIYILVSIITMSGLIFLGSFLVRRR